MGTAKLSGEARERERRRRGRDIEKEEANERRNDW